MDEQMNYGEDYKTVPATSIKSGTGIEVLPDLFTYTIQIVNIHLVGDPKTGDFVLVDAGMPNAHEKIISAVEDRFGEGRRPQAIILTHGHFDHVGAIIELVKYWDVPVYAHKLEMPFLTGKEPYPKPDATVEGGMVAKTSPIFPVDPIDLGDNVEPLPEDGSVPHMPEFKWLHSPGHTPGHVALFRERDRTLIAGDAFVAVRQENLYEVLTQELVISGPPRYLTTDWPSAKESVVTLEALKPSVAVTGHGKPLSGELLADGLKELAENFDEMAKPKHGKYVD
ncbi:MBL fold metallo-hydrolase [Salinicoccus siamensis]|uniref:MBL fold metallo-hydrolase n=1 Tax=Salinicoccus siamensis TaxID=381830 RepID=A0ABV5Z5Z5_9STAP